MSACEERRLPYLFKQRFTRGVKDLIRRMCYNGSTWQADGHDWEVMESTLRLSGWSRERRVIVVRAQAASTPIDENPAHKVRPAKRRGKDRDIIPGAEEWKSAAPWSGKLAVLVTSQDAVEYPASCMAQQYRDRWDAEPERSGNSRPHHVPKKAGKTTTTNSRISGAGTAIASSREEIVAGWLPPVGSTKNWPPAGSWPTSSR